MEHKRTELYCGVGSSDKVYHASFIEVEKNMFQVEFQYGKKYSHLSVSVKPPAPTSYQAALKIYEDQIQKKLKKGYRITNQFELNDKVR